MAHKAIIAQITEVFPIPGADRIHLAKVLGESVVVSKEQGVGYTGVFFPVDLQLSEEFCRENNLFRKAELNKDKTKTGFFEESRRVRAQPFLKQRSEGLFMSIDCLAFAYNYELDMNSLLMETGFQFDEIAGKKICQKYYSEASQKVKGSSNKIKAAKKDYAPFFEKHVDSEQFRHYAERIEKGSLIHIQAKVHGTSARMGYLPVMKELPAWKKRLNHWIGHLTHKQTFKDTYEYDYVVGTRNVVLKTGDETKQGFHGSEQFRFDVFELVKPHLEKGMTIYGEIAGYANGKSIMPVHSVKALKDKAMTAKYGDQVTYKYGCAEHEFRFHIYRITMMNEQGTHIDLTQAQIDRWCADRGLLGPVSVCEPFIYDGDVEVLRNKVEALTERPECLTEDYIDPSHVSEGVIIRVDTGDLTPSFYKSKSFAFRAMEGQVEVADPEDCA